MWDEELPEDYATDASTPGDERVLVAVINRLGDWEVVRSQHWYRIPVAHAPHRLAADYIAFYHTKAFPELRWTIAYYAPIERYRLARRVDLCPDEPDHPRAQHLYYRIEIGPLEALPRPIPSLKLRRVTFIMTTLDRLLSAQEINDLWLRVTARDRLWRALQAREVMAQRRYTIREGALCYEADVAVWCVQRNLAIECVEGDGIWPSVASASCERVLAAHGWTVQRFGVARIMTDLEGCVQDVRSFVQTHGDQPQRLLRF